MTTIRVPDLGGSTMRMVDVDRPDFIHPYFYKPAAETKEMFDDAPNFEFRNDDIMLCTFPKTGTHWTYELISMAHAQSAERIQSSKIQTMMEATSADDINKQASPRVINAHYPYRYLPLTGLRDKQIKTILCLRNPKDTAVSYYNHMRGIIAYDYSGQWEDWLPVYLDGKLEYGKYTDYLKEWEKAIQEDVGFPLLVLYFEDIKANCKEVLQKLLQFLDIDIDEDLQAQIIENCGFHKMASTKYPDHVKEQFSKPGFNIFRKGGIGDWKNWFTDDQKDLFDKHWSSEMKDSTMFNFVDGTNEN